MLKGADPSEEARGSSMFILRHGETLWNVEGRMQGHLDSPLTHHGREQARRQGEILHRAGAAGLPLYCSPLGRAIETARLALPECVPIIDVRLAEVAMGAWQGLSHAEILTASPDTEVAHGAFLWKFAAPGGERLEEMRARVAGFLDDAPAEAVVVTHGVTSQLMRGLLMGLDLARTEGLVDRQGVVFHCRAGREDLLER